MTTATTATIPAGYRLATEADELPSVCPPCGHQRYHDHSNFSYNGWGHDGNWFKCGCPAVVEGEDWQPEPHPMTPAAVPVMVRDWEIAWDSDWLNLNSDGMAA